MNQYPQKNLKVYSQIMGQLVIQPELIDKTGVYRSQLVICPLRMTPEQSEAVAEWASVSQLPIFCHEADISRFVDEGFGAYRFHGLEGYKKVDFEGGSIEFFPAKRKKQGGFAGLFQELSELFGISKPFGYHLFIRPINEKSVLYLASPNLDQADLLVFEKLKPSIILASKNFLKEEWAVLQDRFKETFSFESDLDFVLTNDTNKLDTRPPMAIDVG